LARRNESDGGGIFCGGDRTALRGENFPVNQIDARSAIERRKGHGERGFGKSVDRKLRFAAESVFCEALCEALKRFRIDRLCAIQSGAPRTQV
jgi:hypothetical protein